MSFLTYAENVITNAAGAIAIPAEICNGYHKAVWVQGRDAGLKRARQAVRHNTGEAMPHLKAAPKTLRKELGQTVADFWLAGHEAAVDYVEMKINVFIFEATGGQVLAARFNGK